MRRCVLAVLVLAGGTAAADPPRPLERDDLDRRAARVAFEAASRGTKAYNDGDKEGCVKLYEGALLALAAVLDHRPELVKEIRDRGREADAHPAAADKAFALRKALDAVIEQAGGKRPLWERLGGAKGAAKVVGEFVDRAATEKELDFFRGGDQPADAATLAKLKGSLLGLLSGAAGGPLPAPAAEVKAALAGVKLTGKQFDRLAAILAEVLDANKVPKGDKDELLAVVAGVRKEMVAEK